MATATIPELIQPGTLYTPDDSAVSIASAYLPNTDDALNIDGSIANFRAYQPAISGIHYPANVGDPLSLVWWMHPHRTNSVGPSEISPSCLLAGVMDLTFASSNQIPSRATAGMRWVLGFPTSSNSRSLMLQVAVGASSRAYVSLYGTNPNNALHQYALMIDGSSRVAYYDGINTGFSDASAGTPGTPGAVVSPYFAIGPYSTVSGWSFPTWNIHLAKFSIWNRFLTVQELNDLYTSMTLGPPSP